MLEGLLSGESYKRQNFTGGSNNRFSDYIEKITELFLNLHVSVFQKALVLLGFLWLFFLRGTLTCKLSFVLTALFFKKEFYIPKLCNLVYSLTNLVILIVIFTA